PRMPKAEGRIGMREEDRSGSAAGPDRRHSARLRTTRRGPKRQAREPARTARAWMSMALPTKPTKPTSKSAYQAESERPGEWVDDDQYHDAEVTPGFDAVNPGIVVHGLIVQFGDSASRIPRSSSIVGSRQSQWLAKQPAVVWPSPDTPPFSVPRNAVNTVPFGVVTPNVVLHLYVSCSSCTLPSSVFTSHSRRLFRSVAVPSALSSQRHDAPFFAAASSAIVMDLRNVSSHRAVSGVVPRTSLRRSPSMQKVRLRSAFSFAASHLSSGVGAATAALASASDKIKAQIVVRFMSVQRAAKVVVGLGAAGNVRGGLRPDLSARRLETMVVHRPVEDLHLAGVPFARRVPERRADGQVRAGDGDAEVVRWENVSLVPPEVPRREASTELRAALGPGVREPLWCANRGGRETGARTVDHIHLADVGPPAGVFQRHADGEIQLAVGVEVPGGQGATELIALLAAAAKDEVLVPELTAGRRQTGPRARQIGARARKDVDRAGARPLRRNVGRAGGLGVDLADRLPGDADGKIVSLVSVEISGSERKPEILVLQRNGNDSVAILRPELSTILGEPRTADAVQHDDAPRVGGVRDGLVRHTDRQVRNLVAVEVAAGQRESEEVVGIARSLTGVFLRKQLIAGEHEPVVLLTEENPHGAGGRVREQDERRGGEVGDSDGEVGDAVSIEIAPRERASQVFRQQGRISAGQQVE